MFSMNFQPIDIDSKFALFSEQWSPKVIAKINDYLVKIGKLQGDFVWHKHEETDELFIVNQGVLRVDFRDGSIFLTKGQLLVGRLGCGVPLAEQGGWAMNESSGASA
jgi:mannose-6-phosphate isomerase-like protein (cupin superfamily)